jgi:hypothetical protein
MRAEVDFRWHRLCPVTSVKQEDVLRTELMCCDGSELKVLRCDVIRRTCIVRSSSRKSASTYDYRFQKEIEAAPYRTRC